MDILITGIMMVADFIANRDSDAGGDGNHEIEKAHIEVSFSYGERLNFERN